MKRIVLSVFGSLFLVSTCLRLEIPASAQTVNNPYELVVATSFGVNSVDPAWAWLDDQELIFNVYETLIFYDGESVDEFVPTLATEWAISDDGLTYTFKIREGVKFHNFEILTTEDVEFSFERAMIYGRESAWMLYDALLNVWEANLTDPMFGQKIDNAVQSNASHVWFNLAHPYASFLQILSHPGCSTVNKKFCVEHGDWSGTWDNWQAYYHDPHIQQISPLDDPEPVMCGTGPFKLDDYLLNGHIMAWSVVKFHNYWRGWPAPGSRGYVERVTSESLYIFDWETRKTSFLNGYLDVIYVPRENINEVFGQPGIQCAYPLTQLEGAGILFNHDIRFPNPYLRPPQYIELDYGQLDENGIPPDFFSDAHVRKGFAYSINYTEFLQPVLYGEATYPGTPAIEGLPFRNPEQEKYEFNPAKAEEHFKKAWNGQLWNTGFKLPIGYRSHIPGQKEICEMLKINVESLNPKFHIEALEYYYIGDPADPIEFARMKSLFFPRWIAEYPDLDCLFYNLMHSKAFFPTLQRYSNPTANLLIDEGLHTLDDTRRREIYYELQQIYFENCPGVTMYQPTGRHWERTWVQGWYYNPAHPGIYFYHLWKEDLPMEDLNQDGTVNMQDIARCAVAFGSYYKVGDVHPRWDAKSDINQDADVNIRDIAAIAKKFGSQALPWQPP